MARALCIPFRKPKAELFEPLQYGVNTRGGCEMTAHAGNAHLHTRPDVVLVSLTAGVLSTV
jgi:hypothetical protein